MNATECDDYTIEASDKHLIVTNQILMDRKSTSQPVLASAPRQLSPK